ncbi:hypothetical protein [Synechococcus sp. MIT S9509]|nr:hypothetical protein [Synechococcus sp. MIT S9509]
MLVFQLSVWLKACFQRVIARSSIPLDRLGLSPSCAPFLFGDPGERP